MAEEQSKQSTLDKAAVAKLVKRKVPVLDRDKKPTKKTKLVAVSADEIFAFKEYDNHVVVCTVDGVKLHGNKK